MKRQRGLAQGYIYLLGAIAILGLIVAIGYGIKNYLDGVDAKAYKRGKDECTAAYAQRDNQALREANAEIQRLQNAARAAEQQHAQDLAAIAAQRSKEKADAEDRRKRDIAAARDGSLRLRDPGAAAGCPAPSGLGLRPPPGAGAGRGDGPAPGQLSGAATEFLLELVNDADDVARQLASCQAVVTKDRAAINGP